MILIFLVELEIYWKVYETDFSKYRLTPSVPQDV